MQLLPNRDLDHRHVGGELPWVTPFVSPTAAVVFRDWVALPDGFTFEVDVFARRSFRDGPPRRFGFTSHLHFVAPEEHRWGGLRGELRLGEGEVVTLARWGDTSASVGLTSPRSFGGDRSYTSSYIARGLPPGDVMTIALEWRSRGIRPQTVELPVAELRRAAAAAVPLSALARRSQLVRHEAAKVVLPQTDHARPEYLPRRRVAGGGARLSPASRSLRR